MVDRRREGRTLTQEFVGITIADIGLRCAMRNLSPSGCMVECPDLTPRIGAPVELALLPEYIAQGQVAWQLGESIGIFFLEPIDAHVVRHYASDQWLPRGDWSFGGWALPRS